MRVTVRLFARLRDIAGAAELARDVGARRDDRVGLAASWSREFPDLARYERSISTRRERRLRADGPARSATATRSRFCRRCPADS